MDPAPSPEDVQEVIRSRYIPWLAPLFFPEDPLSPDIVRYFASLLRVVGLEDRGWDPYEESRAVLEDLNVLMQLELPEEKFPDSDLTAWRLALVFYNHIVEMSAPYEVITNLLRFRLGKGYSPNPYYDFLDKSQKNRLKRTDLSPKQKIDIIKNLSAEAGLETGNVFDEFFRPELRNAISHSDFIFTEEGFRCRGGSGLRAFGITFEDLDGILTKAKVFISTFFGLEREARRRWGEYLGRGMPYDTPYKGILEVLVDDESLLNGFKVHWPNNTESVYRRTPDGVEMTNCLLDLEHANIEFFVGSRARRPGEFSPLVEFDSQPEYTPLEGGNGRPTWPEA